MCEIESLETLQLRSNCIQRLPSTIHLLKSLSFLDLSGNHIQSIPPTLFYLRLKVLLLGGNKITTIPREIRQLENCLLELDLSYNSLIELPSDVTLLKSLRVLNLSNNELIDLPQEIGFMHLCALNIEENCLTALPLDFFNLSPYLINLKVNGNPFVSPPVNVILKGREHIFKWLRTQFSIENSQNCGDWNSFNRGTTINATLRRPDKILVQSQLPKSSDPTSTTSLLRKVDRRPRQNRFNTVGGSDSGYASTGDENRLSHEMIMSKGSLEEINESCNVSISPNSTSTNNRLILDREASGDLAKEVMLAYAETQIEKKMAARGAPLSPPSMVTSPTTAAAMDVSNNNIPVKKIIPQHGLPISKMPESKIAPKAAVEEISDESQFSDADFEPSNEKTKMNNNNLTTKSIDSNVAAPNGTLRKQQPTLNSMSKSAISGTALANRKPPTAIGSQPNLANNAIGSQPNLANNGSTTGSLVDTMRKVIEGKLAGTKLPIDKDRLSQELSSGVYLCNFANKIRIRAVPTVFTPSEANLSPLKAKRNADGFVAACKRLGVPENSLCTSTDIIERNNLLQIARTVLALNKLALSNGSITTVIASRV
uniref:Calponin-homology (CH) domain-containing protein n=1 Tax=Panagrolaimus sp. PS1159 TaxID=55785 RepID=A0AC35FV96_9BILA